MEQEKSSISLNEGYLILEEGISKLRRIMGGCTETKFGSEEYIRCYGCVYMLCDHSDNYSQHLHEWYERALEDCIKSQLLPCLMFKSDEYLLQALVKAWSDYKALFKVMLGIFSYLDRTFTSRTQLPSLDVVATECFGKLVFPVQKEKLVYAVNSLIDREREGHQIDADLLKNVSSIVLECDEKFADEFGQAIISGSFSYYSQKASKIASRFSLSDYFTKVQECLDRENVRLLCYFTFIHEHKRQVLLKEIHHLLMAAFDSHLNCNGQAAFQELSDRCAMLSLGEQKTSGSISCMDME